MKKIIIIVLIFTMLNTRVFAEEKGFVDVFEETAVAGDNDIKTFPISVEGEKNRELSGNFNCTGDDICWVEISFYPKHGRIEADGNSMSFTYVPNKNFTGKDRFYYKVSNGRYTSNVSECNIKIKNSYASNKLSAFSYSDMSGNQSEYAAVKLVESDILRGEKIGLCYYFHPKAFVKRSTAASSIYRISKSVHQPITKTAGAFNAAERFPENSEDEVYYACKSGILYGEKYNGQANLRLDGIATRAEFFCMLDRAIGLKDSGMAAEDLSEMPDFAAGSAKRLLAAGIISDKDISLKPDEPITKQEMAELLYKYMCYEKNKPKKSINRQISEKLYPEICI